MKTLLKVILALVILILALMFALPMVFEEKIEELARKEINKNVNAKVDFEDIDLSMFRSFPNFSLGIDKLSVVGKGVFENDTLALIDRFSLTLDLLSVLRADAYEIKKISISSPDIRVRVLESGLTNYDISLPADAEPETSTSDESPFNLVLKSVVVSNGSLAYLDEELKTHITATGLNLKLSGDLSADATMLRINSSIEDLSVESDGLNYLTNSKVSYQANIEADLKNEIYTLEKNELAINKLFLTFDGSVSFMEEGINLVMTFHAPKNEFKSVLSLVPAVYLNDFSELQATGNFSVDGTVKGIYNEEKWPAFNINMLVSDGYFKYPDLPKSVENIQIETAISNPGGDADATVIRVQRFDMNMGGNPLSVGLEMKTPFSDPDINGKFKGEMDLSTVGDFYPLEDAEDLSGAFVFDVTLRGKLSSIEKEEYDKFIAMGTMLVKQVNYSSASLKYPVEITNAQLNFSPQYLDLVLFKMKMGPSDFRAGGKIENYLAYIFSDGKLKGRMNTESDYFNLDDLMGNETGGEANSEKENTDEKGNPESSVIRIPSGLDFSLSSKFKRLVYDSLEMRNVRGKLIVRDETLQLKNLESNVIGGKMTLNGTYSTKGTALPKVDMGFQLKGVDIPATYDNFTLVRKYMPLAKKTKGKLSAAFSFNTSLDKEMMPVYESLNGKGQVSTTEITIDGLNTLVKIANALYLDDLKKMKLNKVFVAFRFINGKMITKPFLLEYNNIKAEVAGWTALDQSIGYTMAMEIPRDALGSEANKLMDDLVKEAEKLGVDYELPKTIKVGVAIDGTLSNPKIRTDLKQSGSDLVKNAKEEMLNQLNKELQQQAGKILREADKMAKQIMDEANKQANSLRKGADRSVAELNKETDKQANALMAEAKKQGLLAELAAKEAIKQLRSQADKQIEKLRSEGDKKADALLKEAKKQSDKIKADARQEADALLKK